MKKKTSEELLQDLKDGMTEKEWHRLCKRYSGKSLETVVWYLSEQNEGHIPKDLLSLLRKEIERECSKEEMKVC